jgi:AraC family transcriptional regulator
MGSGVKDSTLRFYKERLLRVLVSIQQNLDEPLRLEELADIGVQTIPGGDYAVMTHFGPYAKLGESYAKLLGQWLPRSGRNLRTAPCFEVYLNSPESTEPEDLITDLYAPLEP